MDNLGEKLNAGMEKLKSLRDKIPGYKGYAERSERREADSVQREFMAKRLSAIKRALQDVQADCLADGDLSAMEPCDQVGNVIDRLTERVRHASRGYSGFFDAHQVDAAVLARIYEFDMAMVVELNSIEEGVQGLRAAIGGNFVGAVRAVRNSVEDLDSKLNERERILKGVE